MRKILYPIIAVGSLIIRNFYLPNPFECFGDYAIIINWIAEPIIHTLAFGLVGLIYIHGSAPALGSILYLITYSLITGILLLMNIFSFAWWWIAIIVIAIVGIIIGIHYLKERLV